MEWHRYLAMPNPVRIGPIKVNVIGYQNGGAATA
jgi:hypothetical protein